MATLDQMEQFNNGSIFPESYRDTYVAARHIADKKLWVPQDILARLKEGIKEQGLYFGDDSVLRELVIGLVKGNIILQGPPGTGKTSLARILCQAFNVGFDEATAIADWTTYDTIGGLQPDVDGSGREILTGRNGCIVESILHCCDAVVQAAYYGGEKQACWLILDEINRCETDKVFGGLFTAFGSDSQRYAKSIPLWYEKDENKREIYIPNCYRIIGVMNNIDKNFVYDISQGLSRRFTFIEILPPAEEFYEDEVENARTQAGRRAAGKISPHGSAAVDDSYFAAVSASPAFAAAESRMKEFIRHIRYTRQDDASFLGLGLGTAQIVDVYETLYISMVIWGYAERMDTVRMEDVLGVMDGVIAGRIIPQIDGYDYRRLAGFCEEIHGKSEFQGFVRSKKMLGQYIH